MTPSQLRYQVESHNTASHFFSRSNMRFSGDTMANYGVRSAVIQCYDYDNDGNMISRDLIAVEVWELYRKRPVKCGLTSSAYFDKRTFNQKWPVKG